LKLYSSAFFVQRRDSSIRMPIAVGISFGFKPRLRIYESIGRIFNSRVQCLYTLFGIPYF
ncbi:hypothetical protein AAER51_14920, partial [Acinetobacter baumannii]|uniref:hypothetical protein n=1 Tax=Acinetobacter baumannii TaxID=470 RepID=UPI0031F43943